MPWAPKYTEAEARVAIEESRCWADVLRALGLAVHGKNLATLRKWSVRWGISTGHLPSYEPRPTRPRFTEPELRAAVTASRSWAETLRRLRYRSHGGNWKTVKKYVRVWRIDTSHFDPHAASLEGLRRSHKKRRPLRELLVSGSKCSRHDLKARLLAEGLKRPVCEICGQGELWRGKRLALILDHINGVPDDNRLENLRIACPNCAATFDTHCGRKNRKPPRTCRLCGKEFKPKHSSQRYCSRECGQRVGRRVGIGRRRVDRPPHAELLRLVDELGYLGVARLYGVSDTAIRKWVRYYEREAARAEGRDPDAVEIPKRTWPNRRRDRDAA